MAALPNIWDPLSGREGSVGSARVRREVNSFDWQNYPQIPVKKPPMQVFSGLTQKRLEPIAEPDESQFAPEGVESDLLSRVLARIDQLVSPDPEDNDPGATQFAYQTARAIVESAYGRLLADKKTKMKTRSLPVPIVTTEERGGIRVSWQHRDKYVRTTFAAAEGLRSYLYFESPIEHDIDALEPSSLSERLDWILKA